MISKSPGLYLHIPFCAVICPYCDFAVTTGSADRRERFVSALIGELALDHGSWQGFDTVYLGGGTPSALGEEQIERILQSARDHLAITADAVVSMEANPEDVTEAAVRAWVGLGVHRLSLGVQSFDSEELTFLGRRHTSEQARRAVEIGLEAALTVSLDLVYGLPSQSASGWKDNLRIAVGLEPQHISCYQLTVEAGTPFGRQTQRGDWVEPDSDTVADLFFGTHDFLSESGYPAYEVSNFANAPEHRCRHNRKYWEGSPYLGLGPSAHSFDGRERWWNQRGESAWRKEIDAGGRPLAERERLSRDQLLLEALMLGFRTPEGVDVGALLGADGSDLLERNAQTISGLVAEGLLRLDGKRLLPTLRGMARADALARAIEL